MTETSGDQDDQEDDFDPEDEFNPEKDHQNLAGGFPRECSGRFIPMERGNEGPL